MLVWRRQASAAQEGHELVGAQPPELGRIGTATHALQCRAHTGCRSDHGADDDITIGTLLKLDLAVRMQPGPVRATIAES